MFWDGLRWAWNEEIEREREREMEKKTMMKMGSGRSLRIWGEMETAGRFCGESPDLVDSPSLMDVMGHAAGQVGFKRDWVRLTWFSLGGYDGSDWV